MKKLSFFLMAMLFSVMSFAAETVAYTLTPAATGANSSPHNSYASAADWTYEGITWNVTGNSYMVPWRIGGKSITAQDRAVYTKTAMAADITKIEITHATVNITCNSCTLTISDAANGDGETFPVKVTQNTTTTITLPEGDYSNKFYKLVYNVTNTTTSNKYVQLSEIKFYTEVQTSVEAPTFTPEEGKVAANNTFAEPFALTIASATTDATIKYTLDGTDPTLETALTYEAPITISTMVQVRAIAVKGEEKSVESSVAYIISSSEAKPYTASEAIAAEALGLTGTVYVTGTVKSIEELSTQYGNATYNITDGTKELKIYRGKNLENAKFTSADQLLVGDVVVVKGDLTSYNGAAQLAQNNYLISRITAPTTYTVTATVNPAETGTVEGAGEYEEGKEATLTATPAEGYEFVNWTKGEEVVSTENPYTFVVTADVALVANFKEVVVEEPVEAKLYLTPNANWLKDNARFAAYFYGNGETWVSMTKVAGETNLYEVAVPTTKVYPNVIFCRMNPSAAANNWTNKWNQTEDLTIPTDGKNHYTVKENTWDKGGGTWSVWPLPVVRTYVDVTITVTANAPASIKWANAGDKLADATDYVAMTAGENNTYTYTLAQVDEATGVDYTIKVGDFVSVEQNTSKNVTIDFKALLPQVAVQGITDWNGTDKMTIADDYLTASITLPLVAKKYDLKLTVDGAWKGTTSNNITRENNSSAFTGDSGNGSITADVEGDYVFTYTYATKTLTVTYPELVTTITKTFDLTQEEDTRNMGGAYVIYAGDYTLRIYGYNGAGTYQDDPTTEEDAAPMLFTPDYDDALDAVVVVTIDEENNKEVMQVTATSADGKKIYNLTINIALPSYETFNYVATGVTAVPETEEGFTMYLLEGEFDYEGTPVPFEFYATTEPASVMGTIDEEFVMGEGENVAFFIEADNSFFLMAKLQDEQGNIYNIEMMGTVAASQDVEIVVAKEENITLYNLNLDVQGSMAMVSAGNDALSFWLTLLPSENYYGGYMNDAFSNIWYGENQLYAAYGDMHLYGDNNGQVMFVVSFITTPDAEGNVTKYNFTLYPGDQPVDSKHTVTITVNPEGAGTVTGAGEYEEGKEATLTATAAEGYEFVNWTVADSVVSTENPYKFAVTANIALVANFKEVEDPVVELPAANVRAWAYDLALAVEGEQYTFSYKATTDAVATLIFTDANGIELATKELGVVKAGANTAVLAASELPAGSKLNWAIKLEAGAIAEVAEVTDQTRGIYDFYNMMDVLVDNNPESDYFGRIYIQMAYDGADDAATDRSAVQKAGFYLYDQALNELNPESNVSIRPTLPEGYTMGDHRNKFHRLDIDPKTGNLTWCYNVAGQPAVFAVDAANLAGEATNLVAGIEGISRTAAHCFDAEGALYVMDLPAAGTIYKIVNGVATVFAATDSKWVNASMTLAADGKGGLWVAQNRGQIDTYYQLAHYTKDGVLDYAVYQGSENGFTGSSARGALAYNAERQLLAQGRNGKVEVYSVAYDAETGVPALTLVATTPTVGNNIDGLHFDYAGDLYVVNSSKEKFQKFAMPTDNNVCTTPAAAKYAIKLVEEYTVKATVNPAETGVIAGLVEGGVYVKGAEATLTATAAEGYEFVNWTVADSVVSTETTYTFVVEANVELVANFKEAAIEYMVIEDNITNLVIDLESMAIMGGPSTMWQVEVYLGLAEDDNLDGQWSLSPESSVAIMGLDARFIDGYVYDIDVNAPAAKAVLHVEDNGSFYEIKLDMTSTPQEAIVVVVEDATVQIDTIPLFGDQVDYALKMTANWTYAEDGVTYPVLVEVPVYYPEATEPSEIPCTVTVGGEGANDPWLGFGEGTLTITTVDGVVTAKGIVANPYTGVAFDVTVSGKLPAAEPVKHTVTITVNPEGAGTVTGAGEYEDGAEVTVTAEENEGYIFLGWMEDGEFVAEDYEYTFTILNDVDLVAVYATQLLGVAEDLVITETALTATAILSTGTKLTVNLVLGEYDEEEGAYWLAETTTLTLGDKELTFLEGLVMVDTEQQTAIAAVLAEHEGVFYAFTLVLAAPASGVDNINTNVAPRKVIRDGQLIIIKNGVEYNVQGAILK